MVKYFAGIGSRSTPLIIQEYMIEMAVVAANHNWILRSGGANGADSAFEEGCDSALGEKQIFLPWNNFNKRKSIYIEPIPEAYDLAATIHPGFKYLKVGAKKLLARNMHQILGPNLNEPSHLVICYTPDNCTHHSQYSKLTGGTGSAIALASKNNIPIFNLCDDTKITQCIKFLIDNAPDKN
jgi:hypothetical protein